MLNKLSLVTNLILSLILSNKLVRLLLVIFLLSNLTSCSYLPKSVYIQDRDSHYLTAKSIPPMRIPPGHSANSIKSYYPVSDNVYAERNKKVNLLPPGL